MTGIAFFSFDTLAVAVIAAALLRELVIRTKARRQNTARA